MASSPCCAAPTPTAPRRRAIGTVWDVGTFWPRATHPLAPPCYAERAVPEVVDRIRVLTGRVPDHANDPARTSSRRSSGRSGARPGLSVPAGPVLLTGYSQGSILAPAVVAQLPPDARRDTALLTLACPARRLYGRAFPAFFGPEQLAVLATLMTGNDAVRRWTNVVRRSDYIGSWVGRAPGAECALPGLGEVDVWINDPVALVPDAHPAPPTIHRHSGWWPDPQVCPHATKLVDLIDPLAYPPGVPCPDLQHQVSDAVGRAEGDRWSAVRIDRGTRDLTLVDEPLIPEPGLGHLSEASVPRREGGVVAVVVEEGVERLGVGLDGGDRVRRPGGPGRSTRRAAGGVRR